MVSTSNAPRWQKAFSLLRPSHRHSAFSATLLLMASAMASRVIGLVRVKYIAYLFGRGADADAFTAAFQLPDMIAYFLVGGAASITFVTMLSRYHEQGRDAEGERAMSVILSTMALVLGAAILLAEFAAPWYVHWWFVGFSTAKALLCTRLTRILLPAQLCFLAGGVLGAVLLVRKQFAVQAISPLIYSLGTILGGVFFARAIGIESLAIGTVAGALCGPLLMNAIWAHRTGVRVRPILDWSNPGLHEWARMSIPLMLGVSLVTADNWIMNRFASHTGGTIALLAYAKQIFTAPVALGQAAGAASLPFLASLYGKMGDDAQSNSAPFGRAVNASVSRILSFSILLTAFMIAMALPGVDLLLRGGAFHRSDSATMALYFAIFSISLCLWSAQAIYARGFYAAGNTLTPMIAGTIVTFASLPIYWSLYRAMGATGLAIASDLGILIQTLTLAILLDRNGMVPLRGLEYPELVRSIVAAAISFAALTGLHRLLPATTRFEELLLLMAATLAWIAIAAGVLKLTGSALPAQLLARFSKSRSA
ncbi:MAG: virulence factor MviN [Acidobacteriaceae bacterium]|nr:virulence factor MviN [Acidobacteriaceae bacterium]